MIAGGGIAGLAAARQIKNQGRDDFVVLELESSAGGNAAFGENAVTKYPWGAHYVPPANAESADVIDLFQHLGLITGRDENGAFIYAEEALCADPMDRLFTCGRWQEGLIPQIGTKDEDRKQIAAFLEQMEQLRTARGSDERRLFAIPVDESSRDPQWLETDGMTMARWLDQNGWHSPELRWYVDYCCRDDYGAGIAHVSAWAGLHYFASRNAAVANASRDSVLTWPEGNGWLVKKIMEPFADKVRSGMLVNRMTSTEDGVSVDAFDVARGDSVRIRAKRSVCAMPRFVAQRVVSGLEPVNSLEYSPWMVANVTVDQLPEGRGAAPAWDNVFRESRSLGYVVATHQEINPVPRETVLTHYWPLDEAAPVEARRKASERSYESWCEEIASDLTRVHPELNRQIRNLDVWLWGHGMIRPTPGFIWGPERSRMLRPHGHIHFAHSDMSGISIFEEAFTRGVQAARAVLEGTT